jgi:hypothetical protein
LKIVVDVEDWFCLDLPELEFTYGGGYGSGESSNYHGNGTSSGVPELVNNQTIVGYGEGLGFGGGDGRGFGEDRIWL